MPQNYSKKLDSKVWREIQIKCDVSLFGQFTGTIYKDTLFVAGYFVDKYDEQHEAAKIKISNLSNLNLFHLFIS